MERASSTKETIFSPTGVCGSNAKACSLTEFDTALVCPEMAGSGNGAAVGTAGCQQVVFYRDWWYLSPNFDYRTKSTMNLCHHHPT
jgi:hypothetical protein